MIALAVCGMLLAIGLGAAIVVLAVTSARPPGHARVKARLKGLTPPTWTDW